MMMETIPVKTATPFYLQAMQNLTAVPVGRALMPQLKKTE